MLLLAAGDVTISVSVIQWLVGLGLLAGGSAGTALVARVVQGNALTRLQEKMKALDGESLPSRAKSLEASAKELKTADVLGRLKDTERLAKEIETWRQEATQQLEDIDRERFAEAAVKEALASSSTTRGTRPYPKAER